MSITLNWNSLIPSNDINGIALFSLLIVFISILLLFRALYEGRNRAIYTGLIGLVGYLLIFKLSPATMLTAWSMFTMSLMTLYFQVTCETRYEVAEVSE